VTGGITSLEILFGTAHSAMTKVTVLDAKLKPQLAHLQSRYFQLSIDRRTVMNALTTEDLSLEHEMDRSAMTHINGGRLPEEIREIIQYVDAYTHGRCDDDGCWNGWGMEL
jgi:hypothetical protein